MMPADRSDAIRAAVDALVAALVAAVAPEPADAPDRLLSVDEAAAMLGVGRSRLYDEIAAGRLRSLSVGRRRLVPSESIRDYIGSTTRSATPAHVRRTTAGPLPAVVPPPSNVKAAGLRTVAAAPRARPVAPLKADTGGTGHPPARRRSRVSA